jgi:hypothetical protein
MRHHEQMLAVHGGALADSHGGCLSAPEGLKVLHNLM